MKKSAKFILIPIALLMLFPTFVKAKEVGLVVRLKGIATTPREARQYKLSLKDNVLLADRVETARRSRLKMLFDDDSMLTLGANSRLIVKEYYYSDEKKRGKAIFNLIDGRLKSLVGKSEFEVHTPTAVAAARGTYFVIWLAIEKGIRVTYIVVFKGKVEFFNINPAIKEMVTLGPNMMSWIYENMPPAPPVHLPEANMLQINNPEFDFSDEIIPIDVKAVTVVECKEGELVCTGQESQVKQGSPVKQPIKDQQPVSNTTPVHIRVLIP
jgi:hypothetical protein